MTGSVAARRYARALFDLAKRSGMETLEKTGTDLQNVASLTQESPELARLFRDPVFSAEEKRNVLAALADKLEAGVMVRNFLYLLAEKHRLMFLDKIAGEYQMLLDEEKGILRGEIVSAVPLDEAAQADVLGRLAKKSGRSLVLDFKADKALLGGMLLKVGDNVMDASLKTQLSLLKDTIKRGA
ncbi:ATP synthase subunit delta [uncultured delta proteobacterium]|uniref:ATP synthase subunit delta n=1 Tax=uncultured delta proteobacterium TaxID=34034 RepID=A0A212KCB2_9DELT|nr:ATP synthase subunit delta [uncultured delta proteobacterium]